MDASSKIQGSIHDVRLTYKYVSRILGTYHRSMAWTAFFLAIIKIYIYYRNYLINGNYNLLQHLVK